jgi:putative ABC transport system permease protein
MKQFIRNFQKQKTVGTLNICSLSLGVMVSVMVGLWAINELSFDNFHTNRDKIYCCSSHVSMNGSPMESATVPKPLGKTAKDELPQIEDYSGIYKGARDLRINNTLYPQITALSVDNNFFSFFTFPLKEGDATSVLSAPDKVVISETAANQYFSGENPIGQSIWFGETMFTVSGIMKDMPKNSSLQSDFILPFYGSDINPPWGHISKYTIFFTLSEETDLKQLETSLTQFSCKNEPGLERLGFNVTLIPMKEIHFSIGVGNAPFVKGNKPLVMIFVLIAFIILIISCINFTNLFISTSFLRAKSIGVKKSQGAVKSILITDFYKETACYVLISIVAGIFLAYLALPVFNNFTGTNMRIDPLSPQLYGFLAALFVFTVLIAGTFPAFYMTRFNPIQTLSGKFKGKNISAFQKSLIIVQFTTSIALLIIVSFMQKQVNFIIHHDLGFDTENVIYVHGREHFGTNYDALKNELMKDPYITDMTMKKGLPTQWNEGLGFKSEGSDNPVVMEMNRVKPNYFEFMNMKIIEGENPFYLESDNSDINPCIINESALKILNLESPLDKIVSVNGIYNIRIKGVMHNANIRSLRDKVDPQVYVSLKLNQEQRNFVFFKVTGDPQHAVNTIRAKWEELEPNYPFEYHFLDDTYKDLYASEINSQKVFVFAMLITFIISIAGLFAMAFYATQRRIKEIGLRKINGATLKDLLLLLNKDFVIWVLIAFVIAAPIAYFSLQSWLNGFTVKTSLSIWLFLLVGIIAMAVALLTTSFQTWNVATMNPVKTLKAE